MKKIFLLATLVLAFNAVQSADLLSPNQLSQLVNGPQTLTFNVVLQCQATTPLSISYPGSIRLGAVNNPSQTPGIAGGQSGQCQVYLVPQSIAPRPAVATRAVSPRPVVAARAAVTPRRATSARPVGRHVDRHHTNNYRYDDGIRGRRHTEQ
jgi:hypothetical protein